MRYRAGDGGLFLLFLLFLSPVVVVKPEAAERSQVSLNTLIERVHLRPLELQRNADNRAAHGGITANISVTCHRLSVALK